MNFSVELLVSNLNLRRMQTQRLGGQRVGCRRLRYVSDYSNEEGRQPAKRPKQDEEATGVHNLYHLSVDRDKKSGEQLGEQSGEQSVEKPVEKSVEKPVEKLVEKSVEKAVEKAVEKVVEKVLKVGRPRRERVGDKVRCRECSELTKPNQIARHEARCFK